MNYRIKEQFGFFFIEKQIETKTEIKNLFSTLFPKFFKPKITFSKSWFEVGSRGYISGFNNSPIKFKTLKEAKQEIINLFPKYHEYEEFCECNFECRNLEHSTYLTCKICDKKV